MTVAQDYVDHSTDDLDGHRASGSSLSAEHSRHHTAEDDEERSQVDGVAVLQTGIDHVSAAHQHYDGLRCKDKDGHHGDGDDRREDQALHRDTVGIVVPLHPDVAGDGRRDTDTETVSYTDQDAVQRIHYSECRHGVLAQVRNPEAVHDVVEVLDEESHGYGDAQGKHALPLVTKENPDSLRSFGHKTLHWRRI
jgi:hypothetical protein